MDVKLILATDVKVGMYTQGADGWWKITEVGRVDSWVTVSWEVGHSTRGTHFRSDAHALVGMPGVVG